MALRLAHLSSPLLARLTVVGMALAVLALGSLPIWSTAVAKDDQRDLAKAGLQTSGHLRAVQALGDIDTVTDQLEDGLDPELLADLQLAERVLGDALRRMVREDAAPAERQLALDATPVVRELLPQVDAFLDAVGKGGRLGVHEAEERMEDTLEGLQVRFSDVHTDPSQTLNDELEQASARASMVHRVAIVLVPLALLFVALCGWQLRALRRRSLAERVRIEGELRQAQKMEAVGQLAGGVAHDFNNMMSAVIGFSELVLGRLEPGHPARGQIEEIKRAGERASEMTHQLLAFSRKQVLQPRVLDLNAVVAEAEKLLGRLISEDVDLVSVLDPELAPVEADSGQLQQVLMNLAVNARDAMPLGGKLTIETENVELDEDYASRHLDVEPGRYVLLAVSDTGIGMDAATKARIFEPFFTTKRTGEGTGLGLATVYGIVKQSGGDIGVYSEPGRGTTFKIYLPQALAPAHGIEADRAREQPRPGSEAILLVEDEELVRNLGRQALEERGYTVLEAASGGQALEVAHEHEGGIDLLVTDVVMPGLSGRELAEQLAPLRPEMKILYTSGYTDDAIVRHGVLEPGIAFLPKPLTPSSLAHKVREVLDSPNGHGRAPTNDDRSGARATSR